MPQKVLPTYRRVYTVFKNPLFKTTWPITTKFDTKHPWVDGIQIFTNKGPHTSSRGDNSKNNKDVWRIFKKKKNSPELQGQFQTNLA